jgi:2-methylcitrate dehydratase PrpD
LTALIIGNDIVTRLGAASALPHKGWYHTSIYGIFGAAAAASKLLALGKEQTCHAFGIALSQASATQLPNISRTLTKRLSSAFAAHAGVFSALLAARGITAPRLAFEGSFGFYRLYQQGEPELVFAGLGREYPHTQTAIKKYPTCACNHTAIEAALGLVREHALVPDDVETVDVTISPYVDRLVGAPFDPGSDPQVAAQFSVQYSVAVPILRGRFSVLDIEDAAVLDHAVGALARGIRVHVEQTWGNRRCAAVAIKSRRHGMLARHVELIPGGPDAPLSNAELDEKIRNCLGSGPAALSGAAVDQLIARLNTIELVADMAHVFDAIV